ncbi:hypothetical protein [Dyella sp. 2YAF14]|uniref:hypothetical protein n=1 Tax=Dyella sp. 2YAF14 TaxID=3233025 RepID=UPI003F921829
MPREKRNAGEIDARESQELSLTVANAERSSGTTTVGLGFLKTWLGPHSERVITALAKHSRGYSAASETYALRKVLRCWAAKAKSDGLASPGAIVDGETALAALSGLREGFYLTETTKGRALTTTTNSWLSFLRFLPKLVAINALPAIDTSSPAIAAPLAKDVLTARVDEPETSQTTPKTFRPEKNSYNDDLLEPISIIESEIGYIDEYRVRLEEAISTIKACALAEFTEFEQLRDKGRALIESTDFDQIRESYLLVPGSRMRYKDQVNRKHFLKHNGGHPNLLGNLLSVVHHEMAGLPELHRKWGANWSPLPNSGPHWQYISAFGKNELLPYLGVMTAGVAAVCLTIIILEHPKLNPTSLYRATLDDSKGRRILLSSAGEDDNVIRLSTDKPRAGESKCVLLSSVAERVIARVLEWTEPLRAALRRQGRHKEANRLWLGMCQHDYSIRIINEKAFLRGLRGPLSCPSDRNRGIKRPVEGFLGRNPILVRWADNFSFKILRVNAGILIYLNSDGDLVQTALAFGHKSVATTIGHYIPEPLRRAIYERQIRRHQNYLIASSTDDPSISARACDFSTIDELHAFLSSYSSIECPLADQSLRHKGNTGNSNSHTHRIVLMDDPQALAVAMVYRDKLSFASPQFLNRADATTGLKPQFWVDVVDCMLKPLPFSLQPVGRLVIKALAVKPTLQNLRLPDIS